jgi:hypothetical protein
MSLAPQLLASMCRMESASGYVCIVNSGCAWRPSALTATMPTCLATGLPIYFTGTAPLATMTAAPAELRTNSTNLETAGEGVAFVTRKESRVSV